MKKNIVKVALGLPIYEAFDYLIPKNIKNIEIGARLWVPFREKKLLGYAVGFVSHSRFKKLRTVLQLVDKTSLLDNQLLDLAEKISMHYFCSFGQAIEVMLPVALRKGKRITQIQNIAKGSSAENKKPSSKFVLIYDQHNKIRWQTYFNEIKDALSLNQSVIFLVPEFENILGISQQIKKEFNLQPIVLSRVESAKEELANWFGIRQSEKTIVIGTRSAVFAPVNNLGLIIVDEEASKNFKQEQNPFYHARDAALMRAKQAGANVILASQSPSLQAQYLAKKMKMLAIGIKEKQQPVSVSIIDMKEQFAIRRRKYPLISLTLETRMQNVLNQKGRIILFHNRRGFARTMKCKKCGFKLSCSRCDVDLIYSHEDKKLICPYCDYQHKMLELCPNCRSDYIQFKSPGVEKLESELYWLFPSAKIKMFSQSKNIDNFDILVTTQKILDKNLSFKAQLVGIISADTLWNRAHFCAQEEAFAALLKLSNFATDNFLIQTFFPEHICLKALKKGKPNLFYKQELADRKRLNFPPFSHLVSIQTRGLNQTNIERINQHIADKIKSSALSGTTEIISTSPSMPAKLRGKFYYQVLLRVTNITPKFIGSLKNVVTKISSHKAIISVDVDPIR